MKRNIAIVCLDKSVASSTAKLLADQLNMRYFDMRQLFEFDHKPHTFKDIITNYGISYYRQKELSIMKYASDFENVVLNLDFDVSYKKGTLQSLSNDYLIIFLHISPARATNILAKEEYSCYKEKTMFVMPKEKLQTRIENIRVQADIEVNVSTSSLPKVCKDVMRAINKFYNLN